MNDEHNRDVNLNEIPDRVSLKALRNYIPTETELFVVCESYSRDNNKDNKYKESLFVSSSYRECFSFARKLRKFGNHNRITIHNVYKRANGKYSNHYVTEVDRNGATFINSINMNSSQRQYLKNNHLGVYSKDDGLTTDMYDKYMSLLNNKDNK